MNCSNCGQPLGPGHRFCGHCGHPVPIGAREGSAERLYDDQAPATSRARVRLIQAGDEPVWELPGPEHGVGRREGTIQFPNDDTISPSHLTFLYRDDRLYVRDEGSRNGTFIRIHEPVPLSDGEVFLCGEQVLRFELFRPLPPSVGADGAVFCGTPVAPWRFRIRQLLPGGHTGLSSCVRRRRVTIGREDCHVNFPYDRFISHYHARIEEREGEYVLRDLDSRNGSYFRLKREVPLSDGDFLFVGRQLLRVDLD